MQPQTQHTHQFSTAPLGDNHYRGPEFQHPTPPPPTQRTPALAARGLVKRYGATHALAGVELAISRGESIAIMGPSGSGKTTLLHVLAGIIAPDAGSVRLAAAQANGGLDITGMDNKSRTALRSTAFGFVFQQGLLIPELTATDNVALAAMLAGRSRREAQTVAQEWLIRLGLGDHLNKRIGQLSGGQQQRVAIARAQINTPDVTFADEPTGALDSHTSVEVLRILLDTTVGRGGTLVMVTHDPDVAAVCSRVIHLADGHIVHDQRPASQHPGAQPSAHLGGQPEAQPANPQPKLQAGA